VLQATIPSTFVPRVLSFMLEQGADIAPLIANFALPEDAPIRRHVDVSLETLHGMCAAAARTLRDPLLGLHIGLSAYNRVGGTLDVMLTNAPTVGVALEQIDRWQRLFSPFTVTDSRCVGAELVIVYTMPDDPRGPGRENVEYVVTKTVHVVRELSRRPIAPRRVWFSHSTPPDVGPLVDYYGTANIVFDAESSGLAYDREVHAMPVALANPALFAATTDVAGKELGDCAPERDLAAHLRVLVARTLSETEPSLAGIAKDLGMSPRTLQRRLRDQKSSFQDLVDDVRRELALRYVREARMEMNEISDALGYAQPEAFWRAFRRWTGRSPREFRAIA
jgi:AraC-like DNA-binding protein